MVHTVEIDLDGRRSRSRPARWPNRPTALSSFAPEIRWSWSPPASDDEPKPGASFFPLTVDYREYTYAAGQVPGRLHQARRPPSEKEILTSRLIDRPIRPLFPEGYSATKRRSSRMVLSADPEHDPGTLAIVGAGAALAISDIPFHHVLGGVRVGMVERQATSPTRPTTRPATSKLNIVVAGTEDGIVMVEAGAQQASEEEVLAAIEFGHDCCKKIAAASASW